MAGGEGNGIITAQRLTLWNSYQEATELVIDTGISQILGND